ATLLAAGLDDHPGVHVLEPLGYIDFIAAVRGAAAVVTDSGGLQEETTILGVPCLTVRPNTERPITITHGTNRLVTFEDLVPQTRKALDAGHAATSRKPPLWDGHAGPRIAEVVMEFLGD
ncbi:UDP-N-acetylglucosamine 2-epimerase, partial [Actinomadura rugatobispora]